MKRRTPRGLDPEERDLWDRIAQTTTPMHPRRTAVAPKTEDGSGPVASNPRQPLAPFDMGSKKQATRSKTDIAPTIADQVQMQPVMMDKKAFKKLQRGQTKPEARLDLHGMTVAAAHDALTAFIFRSHATGKRLVLVITGKGRKIEDDGPIPRRVGVLRHQVPHWLSTPPLSSMILQTALAHQRHGGSGALYVYLRRT